MIATPLLFWDQTLTYRKWFALSSQKHLTVFYVTQTIQTIPPLLLLTQMVNCDTMNIFSVFFTQSTAPSSCMRLILFPWNNSGLSLEKLLQKRTLILLVHLSQTCAFFLKASSFHLFHKLSTEDCALPGNRQIERTHAEKKCGSLMCKITSWQGKHSSMANSKTGGTAKAEIHDVVPIHIITGYSFETAKFLYQLGKQISYKSVSIYCLWGVGTIFCFHR